MHLLQVSQLQKIYGDHEVVKSINFHINQGECVALLGPNGAGKTTIIKMILDINKLTSGQILLNGKRHDQMRKLIGYLPQHPTFYPWMTGRELLTFMGGLSNIEREILEQRINELLELVGLGKVENQLIGTYSGGMKQRLGIAQALIHQPKLLIMDEPVSALDPLGRRDILELLKVIKQKSTILFSTHILHDAEELCDKMLIINKGQLLVNGSIQQIMEQTQKPIFNIQAPQLSDWVHQLVNEDIVESIELTGNAAKIRVKNIEQGRNWLLSNILNLHLPIQKFELVQESLEEIFLRMVKSF
ncbi:ABC transporter ATP-binding protein [Mammaliicoccus lentus]|uniref:ABC transporter ATP-binding protein n=1 Tax=Mammaliicoccus lentus TaxID=42858 RepID=A0AAX3W418_MAMLE|nr:MULTISPECIES: ABC transporter ATP-binding protein [Bacillales]MBO0994952.1 ABC transporter ATP-binding protein [Bacillus sp. SD088]WHI59989.1 ABC transporter ATP-binding protein [Mammaliicoccus lentus]